MKRNLAAGALVLAWASGASLALAQEAQAVTNRYPVAHVNYQGSNMMIVQIKSDFFPGNALDQARGFSAIQECVRPVNVAGQTLVVAEEDGLFRCYCPKTGTDS